MLQQSVCVIYTATCFDTFLYHHQTVYNQHLAKLHPFFKLQLLEILFLKVKEIKI